MYINICKGKIQGRVIMCECSISWKIEIIHFKDERKRRKEREK
jgi:hypothetical protein